MSSVADEDADEDPMRILQRHKRNLYFSLATTEEKMVTDLRS